MKKSVLVILITLLITLITLTFGKSEEIKIKAWLTTKWEELTDSTFLSLNKKEDIWMGTWITSNWKETTEKIVITKEKDGSYLVTISDFYESNKLYAKVKNDGKVLEVNNGVITFDFIQDLNTKEIMFVGKTYPKLDENLLKEIDTYVVEMRDKILGSWKFEEIRKYGKNPLIDEYNIRVNKTELNNVIEIKTEVIRNRDRENEERIAIEGKVEILPIGRLVSKDKNIDIGRFFPRDSYAYNIKRFERFKKIGAN